MISSKRKRITEYGLKRIVVSQRNYLTLKTLGQTGDSFNDVITKLLLIQRNYQKEKKEKKQEEEQQQHLPQQQQGEECSNDRHNHSIQNVIIEPYPSHLVDEAVKQQRHNIEDIMRAIEESKEGKK